MVMMVVMMMVMMMRRMRIRMLVRLLLCCHQLGPPPDFSQLRDRTLTGAGVGREAVHRPVPRLPRPPATPPGLEG